MREEKFRKPLDKRRYTYGSVHVCTYIDSARFLACLGSSWGGYFVFCFSFRYLFIQSQRYLYRAIRIFTAVSVYDSTRSSNIVPVYTYDTWYQVHIFLCTYICTYRNIVCLEGEY